MKFSIKFPFLLIIALLLVALTGVLIRQNDKPESQSEGDGVANEEVLASLPVYPGSKLINSSSSTSENKESSSYVWEVSESVENLSSFFADELENDGWSVEINSLVISYKKDNTEGFIGLAKKSDDITIVSATLTKNR